MPDGAGDQLVRGKFCVVLNLKGEIPLVSDVPQGHHERLPLRGTAEGEKVVGAHVQVVGDVGRLQALSNEPGQLGRVLPADGGVLHVEADADVGAGEGVHQLDQILHRGGVALPGGNVQVPEVFKGDAHVPLFRVLQYREEIGPVFLQGTPAGFRRLEIRARVDGHPGNPHQLGAVDGPEDQGVQFLPALRQGIAEVIKRGVGLAEGDAVQGGGLRGPADPPPPVTVHKGEAEIGVVHKVEVHPLVAPLAAEADALVQASLLSAGAVKVDVG